MKRRSSVLAVRSKIFEKRRRIYFRKKQNKAELVEDFVQPQFSFLTTALGQLACLAPQMFMPLILLFC